MHQQMEILLRRMTFRQKIVQQEHQVSLYTSNVRHLSMERKERVNAHTLKSNGALKNHL
jgi:hypothetical protein